MKKRPKRKTSGSSCLSNLAVVVLLLCPAFAEAKKDKVKAQPNSFALIAGTVYRPPGFAFPKVPVKLVPEQDTFGGVKLKKVTVLTDARGEWAVRVPPVPAKWLINVDVDKYRPEQRFVSITGEHRVDLSITLEPVQ